MQDQHSHHFLGLGGDGVLLCSVLPGSRWLLPCAVPRGSIASWAARTSTWPYTSRRGGLPWTRFLPVL